MAYLLQQRRDGSGDTAWLALLVQTFETLACDAPKSCDPASIAALKAQLARPAAVLAIRSGALH